MDTSLFPRCFAAALCLVAVGCGGDGGGDDGSASSDGPTREELIAQKADQLDVSIDEPVDFDETTRTSLTVRGVVQPADAEVTVNGRAAEVSGDGRWETSVDLELGSNSVNAKASVSGSTARANASVTIRRTRTAAQRRAFRAAQKRKREARLAEVRANAREIDPELLQKDPDRYSGDLVKVAGQIFQIQEGGDNFMLLNTKCSTEYDITLCDGPTVHVFYDQSTNKTEDDLVVVYGRVEGGLDYDTAIGGSNYVASVEGEIIE